MKRTTMAGQTILFLMIAAALVISGCEKISGMFGNKQDAEITAAYQQYRSAMMSGDIQTLKGLVAREKAQELDRPEAAQMLALARGFMPPTADITAIAVQGDAATLTASAMDGANTVQGTIHMLKEDGRWKVYDESWNMQINMQAGAEQPAALPPQQNEGTRPYEYEKIVGIWKGTEAGGASGEWTFSIHNNYHVAIESPSGPYFKGDAVVEKDLGIDGGGIRVLPGGAPFDMRVTDARNVAAVGQRSLGSYKFSAGQLHICLGEPGLMNRTSDFGTSGGIHCFDLRKSQDLPAAPSVAQQAQPAASSQQPAQPQAVQSTFSKQDPGVSGEAIVVKDGKTETYPLVTGFFSNTRFANPSRATIQFQAPAPEHSNARRIEIVLDATRTGTHYADGKLLNDTFMSEEKLRIGERTSQGYTASFRWVADGGQIFFPKTSCTVNITSAYSGSPSSEFSGEVRDCAVHSAGIDYQLSSVRFSMKGAPKR